MTLLRGISKRMRTSGPQMDPVTMSSMRVTGIPVGHLEIAYAFACLPSFSFSRCGPTGSTCLHDIKAARHK
jgi:hypothetical protein